MRALALAPAVLLAACGPTTPTVIGYDPGANLADCYTNSPPFVGNVELNSEYFPDQDGWGVSIHFDWADPGVQGAADPPNILFGYFSGETNGWDMESVILSPANLRDACLPVPGEEPPADPVSGEPLAPCEPFEGAPWPGHSFNGCADPAACAAGELNHIAIYEDMDEWTPLDISFRVRDRCGASSNEVVIADYIVGSGLQVQGAAPEEGGEGEGQ